MPSKQKKGYKGLAMEGLIARWYARNTGRMIDQYQKAAQDIAAQLPTGSYVLEVAPGPGYFAIALAKLGTFHIVGLDISHSFVDIASENAGKAGVEVDFRQGNASAMPLDSDAFDFIYCRAAFKNFSEPVGAISEMHRVLKPGGKAVIHDLRRDTSFSDIRAAVNQMGLNWINTLMTKLIFRQLIKRAYSKEDFEHLVAQTPFQTTEIKTDLIGLEVSLRK